jgi:heme-degrading monooxygenase HmoA
VTHLAQTPEPPYYAVIFTSRLGGDTAGYAETADRMMALAAEQEGYLGVETARADIGITVSYWRDLEAVRAWRDHADHAEARRLGRERWYGEYRLRICRVEREYGMRQSGG